MACRKRTRLVLFAVGLLGFKCAEGLRLPKWSLASYATSSSSPATCSSSSSFALRPAGPRPLPFAGHALHLQQLGDLSEMAALFANEYGAVTSAKLLGGREVIFVAQPDLVKEVMISNANCFRGTQQLAESERLQRMLGPLFQNPLVLAQHVDLITAECHSMLEARGGGRAQGWPMSAQVLSQQRASEVVADFRTLSFNCLIRIFLSSSFMPFRAGSSLKDRGMDSKGNLPRVSGVRASLKPLRIPFEGAAEGAVRVIASARIHWNQLAAQLRFAYDDSFTPQEFAQAYTNRAGQVAKMQTRLTQKWLPWQSQTSKVGGIGSGITEQALMHAEKLVRERYGGSPLRPSRGDDLLDYLMAESFTVDEALGIINRLLLAGADSTASTVSVALMEIRRNPAAWARAIEEAAALSRQAKGVMPTHDLITSECPYLTACVKESLRLHPLSPLMFRIASEDSCIGEYHAPKNSLVIMSASALGRDPRLWEKPNAFIPERHLVGSQHSAPSDLAWLPFGAGPSSCVGSKLAMLQATCTVAMVMAKAASEEDMFEVV
jgi:cytochrome P450